MTPAGVVLAAGAGTRLGRPKALVRTGAELLVERAVRTVRAGGCDPVVVVLGAQAEDVRAAADLGDAVVVENAAWETGMGSSLRCGLDAAARTGAPAAVVALVDQPGITPAVVDRLVARWRDGAVAVVATYGSEPRNPVVLDAAVWSEVADRATGDVGARAWLRANPERVVAVPCDDIAVADDIDTPADLAMLMTEPTVEST
ncbi:MAG TPA: nucleotidyltransferase family protein [Mycobacteriales bacterium]|nr:nucleotidyltransferase family protein [Mycobacteriales bacterium]